MSTALLIVIYVAFISLGLPDSVLGTAWPLMHQDLGASIGSAGLINMVVSIGTMLASTSSQRVIKRFGTHAVSAFSILLTLCALFAFSASHHLAAVLIAAIPLGFGAGAIDTALNNYVAKHYSAMQMNLLHAFWGIGTIIAPIMLSRFFDSGRSWREGYVILGTLQSIIFVIFVLSRPLWRIHADEADEDGKASKVYSMRELVKTPGVLPSCLAFTFYTFEGTTMLWLASHLVYGRGMDASTAASISSMTYIGITAGRICTSFIADRVRPETLIRSSQAMILAAILAMLFTDNAVALHVIIFAMGFCFGPIYPAMVRQTVSCFPADRSVGIIGLQFSFGYFGSLVLPPLYGLLASVLGQWLLPWYLLFLVIVHSACMALKIRATKHAKAVDEVPPHR